MTGRLQSEIQNAVNLCTKGLNQRFDILLNAIEAESRPSTKVPEFDPKEVVRDLLIFNVDARHTCVGELMKYGREEVQRLTNWFEVALERAGCNTKDIIEQWVSLKIQVNSQFRKLNYINLWQTLLNEVPNKEDFKDVLHLQQRSFLFY